MDTLQTMIYKRRSVRAYTPEPVDDAALDALRRFIADAKPLAEGLGLSFAFVRRAQVKTFVPLRWLPEQMIAIYAEKDPLCLENVGFVFQQADLWLQSRGLGACWLGMGRLAPGVVPPGVEPFAMLLAFGQPQPGGGQRGMSEFRRKGLDEIADRADPRLEPARLAPSSMNSQPWYFVHDADGGTVHVYCVRGGVLKNGAPGAMNRIDIGIALAHLYVSAPETFRFCTVQSAPAVKGYAYTGSFTL